MLIRSIPGAERGVQEEGRAHGGGPVAGAFSPTSCRDGGVGSMHGNGFDPGSPPALAVAHAPAQPAVGRGAGMGWGKGLHHLSPSGSARESWPLKSRRLTTSPPDRSRPYRPRLPGDCRDSVARRQRVQHGLRGPGACSAERGVFGRFSRPDPQEHCPNLQLCP
jgi:hypothetical protein